VPMVSIRASPSPGEVIDALRIATQQWKRPDQISSHVQSVRYCIPSRFYLLFDAFSNLSQPHMSPLCEHPYTSRHGNISAHPDSPEWRPKRSAGSNQQQSSIQSTISNLPFRSECNSTPSRAPMLSGVALCRPRPQSAPSSPARGPLCPPTEHSTLLCKVARPWGVSSSPCTHERYVASTSSLRTMAGVPLGVVPPRSPSTSVRDPSDRRQAGTVWVRPGTVSLSWAVKKPQGA